MGNSGETPEVRTGAGRLRHVIRRPYGRERQRANQRVRQAAAAADATSVAGGGGFGLREHLGAFWIIGLDGEGGFERRDRLARRGRA